MKQKNRIQFVSNRKISFHLQQSGGGLHETASAVALEAQGAKVKWLDQLLAEEEDLASQMIFPSSGIRW